MRAESFNGKKNRHWLVCILRVTSVLEDKDLAGVVIGSKTSTDTSDENRYWIDDEGCHVAKVVIVSPLRDRLSHVVQSAPSPADMWTSLTASHGVCLTGNKICVLNSSMNTRYSSGRDMGNYLGELQTFFNKLCSTGLQVVEEMRVAIFWSH